MGKKPFASSLFNAKVARSPSGWDVADGTWLGRQNVSWVIEHGLGGAHPLPQ